MKNRGLRYRAAFSNAIDADLMEKFDELSVILGIPKSKLLDEAIRGLLIQRNYKEEKRKYVERMKQTDELINDDDEMGSISIFSKSRMHQENE